jgi:hypothetical protein
MGFRKKGSDDGVTVRAAAYIYREYMRIFGVSLYLTIVERASFASDHYCSLLTPASVAAVTLLEHGVDNSGHGVHIKHRTNGACRHPGPNRPIGEYYQCSYVDLE